MILSETYTIQFLSTLLRIISYYDDCNIWLYNYLTFILKNNIMYLHIIWNQHFMMKLYILDDIVSTFILHAFWYYRFEN